MGIRVDGLDTLTQTIPAGALSATNGKIAFYYTPRHSSGDWEKFGNNNEYVCLAWYDAENRIYLRTITATNAQLSIEVGNVLTDGTSIDMTGLVDAGTKYLIEIEYSSTQITWSLDGAVISTITPAGGIDFGAKIPSTFFAGTNQSGVFQSDAVFS